MADEEAVACENCHKVHRDPNGKPAKRCAAILAEKAAASPASPAPAADDDVKVEKKAAPHRKPVEEPQKLYKHTTMHKGKLVQTGSAITS